MSTELNYQMTPEQITEQAQDELRKLNYEMTQLHLTLWKTRNKPKREKLMAKRDAMQKRIDELQDIVEK